MGNFTAAQNKMLHTVAGGLRLLVDPMHVVELRALGCQTSSYRKPHTRAGFFDVDHLDLMAKTALELNNISGAVYLTLNPVHRDLLSRRANRVDVSDSGTLAADVNITGRRWLLIDVDPVRIAGVSSTASEKHAASEIIEAIRSHLRELGWPEPILCDSANGFHLLYRIDIPADDGGLIKRCLKALAHRFDTDAAKVDPSVFNPSRIVKLYGTISRKGDHTPDRPHRRSAIIEIPDPITPVPVDLLEALAAIETQESEQQGSQQRGSQKAGTGTRGANVTDRARRYISQLPPAISGESGHDATYKAACRLIEGFDLSVAEAFPLLAEWNQTHCQPPWSEVELRHKLSDADKNATNRGYLLNGRDRRDAWTASHEDSPISGSEPTGRSWPHIISLDEMDLPSFPTYALPPVLSAWIEAESHATQTPADLAGLLALAVCSACIARRVIVEPRQGWREPSNLFVAVLLDPGNRKSAVFADAMQPLRELESELIEAARPQVARDQSERRQAEARLKKLEKLAAEKDDFNARHEAANLAEELAVKPEPVLPRTIVDDATSEKLGMMLAEQGGRIASMSPEGGVFDLMAGLYSKSGIPQFGVYLMGHSGDDLITDRVSRKSVRVERPALTCAYTIQPAVIKGLAEHAALRGRGLLARFLYAAPQSWIGRREIAPPPVPDAAREAYRQAVRALAASFENIESASAPFQLQLSPDASSALQAWEADIEAMLNDGGQMEIMRDWGAKLAGATLRLAAVLHCVEQGPRGRIDEATLAAAIEIAHYLIPHAEAVLNLMSASEDSAAEDARYVLRWIERHGRQEFTKREAQQHGRRRFPKAEDIDPALAELTQRGYIRLKPVESTSPGRPPSPTYEVNPAVFQNEQVEKRSQYSQNSRGGHESTNSANPEKRSQYSQNYSSAPTSTVSESPEKRSQYSQNPAGGQESASSENIESAFEPSETTNRVRTTI